MDIYQALIQGEGDPNELARELRRRSTLGTLGAMSGVKQAQQVGQGLQQEVEQQTRGLAQARQQQDLQRLRNEGKSSGGGTTGILQVANRLQTERGIPFEQALDEAAFAMRNSYSIKDVAGVPTLNSTVRGVGPALSDINTVAGNAGIVNAAKAEGDVAGKADAERFYDAPGALARIKGIAETNNRVAAKARRVYDDPALGRVTGLMAYIPSVYGGKAANVEAVMESLEVEQAFQALQDMRDNSKTGGALGQVSDRENQMLRVAVTNLSKSQSADQYRKHLEEIISRMEGMNARLQAAWEAEYGKGAKSLRAEGNALPRATGKQAPEDPILKALKAMEQQ